MSDGSKEGRREIEHPRHHVFYLGKETVPVFSRPRHLTPCHRSDSGYPQNQIKSSGAPTKTLPSVGK